MEMEKNCCSEKGCENCSKENQMKGCCAWKKCHMMKIIIHVVIIILAFTIGSQIGELKSSFRHGDNYGCGMMNWGGERNFKQIRINDSIKNLEAVKEVAPVTNQ